MTEPTPSMLENGMASATGNASRRTAEQNQRDTTHITFAESQPAHRPGRRLREVVQRVMNTHEGSPPSTGPRDSAEDAPPLPDRPATSEPATAGVESGARKHTSAVTDNAASTGAAPSQNCGAGDTGPASGGLQEQGVHRDGGQRDQPRYTSSDVDYEKKYAPDAYGKELSKNARVWSVYNDEAQIADEAMIKELNGTLDVLLVFAGLFSAVVTTFVAQSSQALNPDYAQITASLVYELVLMQRAARAGTSGEVPASSLDLASRTSQTTDLWVNGLWLGSLMTALLTALVSVLAKQWIQYYNSLSMGSSPRERAHLRHFRLKGFQRWRVQEIIGFLPALLTVALLLFFAGLVVYVAPMNAVLSWVIIGLAVAIFLSYASATIIPVFAPHCAYKTPLAHYILVLHIAGDRLYRRFLLLIAFVYQRSETETSWSSYRFWGLVAAMRPQTIQSCERDAVRSASDYLTESTLLWLAHLPVSASVTNVSLQAASALKAESVTHVTEETSYRQSLYYDCRASMLTNERAAVAERLARSAMHRHSHYLFYFRQVWSLDVWEQLYTHRHRFSSAAIKAVLCAVCWIRFCEDEHALANSSALLRALEAFALLDISSKPKLHPVMWREISYMANACLLLCDGQPLAGGHHAYQLHEMITDVGQHAPYAPPDGEEFYEDTAVTLDQYCEGCRWEGGREKFLSDLEKLKHALSERLEKLENERKAGGQHAGNAVGQQASPIDVVEESVVGVQMELPRPDGLASIGTSHDGQSMVAEVGSLQLEGHTLDESRPGAGSRSTGVQACSATAGDPNVPFERTASSAVDSAAFGRNSPGFDNVDSPVEAQHPRRADAEEPGAGLMGLVPMDAHRARLSDDYEQREVIGRLEAHAPATGTPDSTNGEGVVAGESHVPANPASAAASAERGVHVVGTGASEGVPVAGQETDAASAGNIGEDEWRAGPGDVMNFGPTEHQGTGEIEEGKEGGGTSEGGGRSASEVAGPSAQSPPSLRSTASQEACASIDSAGDRARRVWEAGRRWFCSRRLLASARYFGQWYEQGIRRG